jgi:hypothetical protein
LRKGEPPAEIRKRFFYFPTSTEFIISFALITYENQEDLPIE